MRRNGISKGRLVALVLAGLALALPQAQAQASFYNERLDGRTLTDADIQASIVTDSTIRSSDVTDSRLHGMRIFTSNLEADAISSALLRNDRVRLAAIDRATVQDSALNGVVATRTAFDGATLDDFSVRGTTIAGGSIMNGVIQDTALRGGVVVCNVYDRSTGRYYTNGCGQLGETVRSQGDVRATARDLERTLIGALTVARDVRLELPAIREQGFFLRVDEGEPTAEAPTVDDVLAIVSEGEVPDAPTEEGLPPGGIVGAPDEGLPGAEEQPIAQEDVGGGSPEVDEGLPEDEPIEPPEEGLPG